MTTDGSTPILAVTDEARAKVLGFREQAPTPERQAMWIEITGISGGEWSYNMSLRPVEEARPDDHVERHGDLTVVVPAHGAEKLRGATVEWSGDLFAGGLKLTGLSRSRDVAETYTSFVLRSSPTCPDAFNCLTNVSRTS